MDIKNITLKVTGATAGVLLVTGVAAVAPALADYPPTGGNNSPAQTTSNPASVSTGTSAAQNGGSGSLPAYTGAETTLGLLAGLAIVGAGSGLLIASRRRTN